MLLLKGWHPLPLVTNVLHSPLVQGQLILLIPLMIKEGGDISHFVLLLVLFGLNTFLTISSDLFHFPHSLSSTQMTSFDGFDIIQLILMTHTKDRNVKEMHQFHRNML